MVITSGVGFALLSLFCAGLNDVVFKKYSSKVRSRGMYICGIGIIWLVLQTAHLFYSGQILALDSTSLTFGIIAGIAVTVSNILLLACLTHIEVSLGSTIYRLNTIGVVILSIIFLGEVFTTLKISGILCGIVAVLFLYRQSSPMPLEHHVTWRFYVMLIIFASALRAGYGVISKAGISAGADINTMIFISAICWIIGGFVFALLVEKRVKITKTKIIYSALSGILVYLIVNFLIAALARGDASIVVPIANMSFIISLLVSSILRLEYLTRRKIIAVLLAALSITQLTYSG